MGSQKGRVRNLFRATVLGGAALAAFGVIPPFGQPVLAAASSGLSAGAAIPPLSLVGTRWSVRSGPPGVDLSILSCGGAGFCVAAPGTGHVAYVSLDFGTTWTSHELPANVVYLDGASCGSVTNCMLTGNDDGADSFTLSTDSRGQTWTEVEDPIGGTFDIPWLSCPDALHCVAAGEVTGPIPTPLAAGWTADGGARWQSPEGSFPGGGLATGYATLGCAAADAFFMANGGLGDPGYSSSPVRVLFSSDGGMRWTERGNVLSGLLAPNAIACLNKTACVLVGDTAREGAAWLTTDAGQAWKPANIPANVKHLDDVACSNVDTCWAIGQVASPAGAQSGAILETTDGGSIWAVQMTVAGQGFGSISCATGHCVAVGSHLVAQLVYPTTAIASSPEGAGYDLVSADGTVYPHGDGAAEGDLVRTPPATPVSAISLTGDGRGYWVTTAGGAVYRFGDARNYGSEAGHHLAAPIVGFAPTPDGRGYYLVGADGGVFCFGDAIYRGSMVGKHLNGRIVGIGVDRRTGGYWLAASDGGLFAFHAPFLGSAGELHLTSPIVGLDPLASGDGYRFVASDGGVFDFGAARFSGSLGGKRLTSPVSGIASQLSGAGYWLVQADGTVTAFGGARIYP